MNGVYAGSSLPLLVLMGGYLDPGVDVEVVKVTIASSVALLDPTPSKVLTLLFLPLALSLGAHQRRRYAHQQLALVFESPKLH